MYKFLVKVGKDKKEIEFTVKDGNSNKEFLVKLGAGMLLHGFDLEGNDEIEIAEIEEIKE